MDAGEENHWGIKVMTYSNNNSNWGEERKLLLLPHVDGCRVFGRAE